MAEYDLDLNIKAKADATGVDNLNDSLKETKQNLDNVIKGAKETKKTLTANDAIGIAKSASRLEAFQKRLEGEGSKLAQLLNSDKVNDGAVGRSILGIKNTMSEIEKLTVKTSPERALANAVSPEQAAQMAKMTSEVDILRTKLRLAAEELANLYNTGGSAKEFTKAVDNVRRLSNKLDALEESAKAQNIPKESASAVNIISPEMAGQIAESTSKLQILEAKAESARRKLSELFMQNADNGTIARATEQYQKLLSQIEALKAPQVEEVATANTAVEETAVQATGSTSKLERAMSSLRDSAVGLARVMGGRVVSSIQKYTKGINTLLSSFKRILFYRMVRTVIKDIGQAFTEGTKNLYQWSKLANGEFAESMDKIATTALYVKNSLGAMLAPIINAITPAIEHLAEVFVTLVNAINQVLSALTGASEWTKAIKFPTEYAKATDKATKAAKNFGLAQIDQLTILNKQKDSNTTGFSAEDYSNMFEKQATDPIWDKVKKSIEFGDWRGAGKLLAEKLNEIVAGLDTYSWGLQVGNFLNKGIEFAYGFLKFTNFVMIGKKIAEFLNGCLDSIHWETLGRLFVRMKTLIFDTLIGAVTALDFKAVGRAINQFLIGALNEFDEWLDTVDLDNLGDTITQKLVDLVEGLDLDKVASTFIKVLFKAIAKSWEAGFSLLKGIFEKSGEYLTKNADRTGQKAEKITKSHWDNTNKNSKSIWGQITDTIWDAGVKIGTINDRDMTSVEKRMALFGARIYSSTDSAFGQATSSASTKMNNLKSTSETDARQIETNISKSWSGLSSGASSAWNSVYSTVSSAINRIKSLTNFSWSLPHIKIPHFRVTGSLGWSLSGGLTMPKISVDWYKNGGFPDAGQLFIANEAGPEMVGTMGSRTAVANNGQIVTGIREGVYDAMMSAMQSGSFKADVYIDGKRVTDTVVSNINSQTRRTGSSPLLV